MMNKGFRNIEIFISDNISEPSDYMYLPVVKDGQAIGIVDGAVKENWVGIKLTVKMWVNVETWEDTGKPSAIII